jgi:hypothetical protein
MVPEYYIYEDEEDQEDLFWVKIMKPNQPFKFAEDKMLYSKPICWTTKAKRLSGMLKIPAKTIEETQQKLLFQSLLNSIPVIPDLLKEYEEELLLTADFLRDLEKIPILIDEMKDGFEYFTVEVDASSINRADNDAKSKVEKKDDDKEL